jgi:DNA mismatch repair protein MutS
LHHGTTEHNQTVIPQTPMLKQYYAAKAEHPGVVMAMRVGDFYEFYGEDATIAARALEITLTGKDDGSNGKVAMAGVPYHAVERYLARLLQQGIKVAICDQLEDSKAVKGLVKRGVTRVMTPGTLVEDSLLASGQNSFLSAIFRGDDRVGLATLDPSTGEFVVTEVASSESSNQILPELARLRPSELLIGSDAEELSEAAAVGLGITVTPVDSPRLDRADRLLKTKFGVASLSGFGCDDKPTAIIAAAMVLEYATKNGLALDHVATVTTYATDEFMRLDPATRRSLELTQNLSDGSRKFTLLSIIDETLTAMGARLIRRWVDQPLLDRQRIQERQDAVRRFTDHPMVRGDIRDLLRRVADMERLVSRCATGHAGPHDLDALRTSLDILPLLAEPLVKVSLGRLQYVREQLGDHRELALLLHRALLSDLPMTIRDGGVIRAEYDPELDKLRDLARNGKSYIAALEAQERERTGITNLKVGFNSVFGYFLEVGKNQTDRVPSHYIRKQTTAAAERYITAELKEHESLVLGAQEKAVALESDLFFRLRSRIAEQAVDLLKTARALAELDALAGLAEAAVKRHYVAPELTEGNGLEILGGRHPVVEVTSSGFVPNDLAIRAEPRVLIITGPNMAGKSTYLRQCALITLLAQIGSFVPAKVARIGLCDRIFARIGAKDELALGQSTFMVEMVESANILNHATDRSLVILDEVGRGTSTFDGLAIAWSMVEFLAELGAKTLFATHYHQLNALSVQLPAVANFRVSVDEIGDDIIWTHRVLPGGTDRSYGVHVARMAGVPPLVLERAKTILRELEEKDSSPRAIPTQRQALQLTLFEVEDSAIVQELRGMDVNAVTPLQALTLLERWKRDL